MQGCENAAIRQGKKIDARAKSKSPSLGPGTSVTKKKPKNQKERLLIPGSNEDSGDGFVPPLLRGLDKVVPEGLRRGN